VHAALISQQSRFHSRRSPVKRTLCSPQFRLNGVQGRGAEQPLRHHAHALHVRGDQLASAQERSPDSTPLCELRQRCSGARRNAAGAVAASWHRAGRRTRSAARDASVTRGAASNVCALSVDSTPLAQLALCHKQPAAGIPPQPKNGVDPAPEVAPKDFAATPVHAREVHAISAELPVVGEAHVRVCPHSVAKATPAHKSADSQQLLGAKRRRSSRGGAACEPPALVNPAPCTAGAPFGTAAARTSAAGPETRSRSTKRRCLDKPAQVQDRGLLSEIICPLHKPLRPSRMTLQARAQVRRPDMIMTLAYAIACWHIVVNAFHGLALSQARLTVVRGDLTSS
jgi:hypothetical protein